MKRMKLIATVLAFMMLFVLLAACAETGNDGDTTQSPAPETTEGGESAEGLVTLTAFMNSPAWSASTWGSDPVSQRMMEMTGVTFTFEVNAEDTETRLNLIVAGGDLPDLLHIPRESLATRTMIQDEMLISWEALFNDYLPDAMQTSFIQRNEEILRGLYEFTGEIWTVPNNFVDRRYIDNGTYIMQTPGYYARGTMLDAIGNPTLVTLDDLENVLRLAVENDPSLTDPLFLWNPVNIGWDANGITILYRSMGGRAVQNFFIQADGSLSHIARDPLFRDTLMFVNRMFNEGFISHNTFTDGTAEQEAVNVSDNWVVAVGHYWRSIVPQDIFEDIVPVPHLAQPGVDYFGPVMNLNGDNSLFVSATNSNLEATARLLDAMISDEWQGLASGGIYGEHWEWGGPTNNWLIPIGEAAEILDIGFGEWMELTGAFRYLFTANQGLDSALAWGMASADPWRVELFNTQNAGIDATRWENLDPPAETLEGASLARITDDILHPFVARIAMASNEQAAQALFDEMLADMEAQGLADIEAVWNANLNR